MSKETFRPVYLYPSYTIDAPMKTIRIKLPEELERDIIALTADREAFILEALKEKIEKEKKAQLKKHLTEGGQSTFDEDPNHPKGFEPADFEYWQ